MNISNKLLVEFNKKFPFVHLVYGQSLFEHAFAEASDDSKRRAKATIEELAKEYNEANTEKDHVTCVVIDHILNTRLIAMQNKTTLFAAGISAFVAIAVTILGFWLGASSNCPPKIDTFKDMNPVLSVTYHHGQPSFLHYNVVGRELDRGRFDAQPVKNRLLFGGVPGFHYHPLGQLQGRCSLVD